MDMFDNLAEAMMAVIAIAVSIILYFTNQPTP